MRTNGLLKCCYLLLQSAARRIGKRSNGAMLLGCLFLILAACQESGRSSPTPTSPTSAGPVEVTFAQSASYEGALSAMTDLGLTLSPLCDGGWQVETGNATTQWLRWRSESQQDGFNAGHSLVVEPTPLAPSDWLDRLRARSDVEAIKTRLVFMGCPPIMLDATPPPNTPLLLTQAQTGTYLRVTFAAPLNTYEGALDAMTNLGFRLADPCYEQAHAPAWHLMGQEQPFSASHALVLATTQGNSNQWREQVQSVAGVVAVEASLTVHC